MINVRRLCATILILSVSGVLATLAAQQDSTSQIRNKLARLQRSLKEKPITDADYAELATGAGSALSGAADSLNRGRVYLSLLQLESAAGLAQGARSAGDNDEVMKGGLPAFEEKWGKASLELTKFDEQAKSRDWSHAPLAVRALAETAQGQALPLLEGGRGFATATGPKDGLLYIGQAQGEADFARFCATLNFTNLKSAPRLRSLLPELVALQQKTNEAFQPPRSIDLHSRFIMLNSALKLAEELDSRQFYAGAFYEYLEALRNYGMLDAPPIDAARQPALKAALAAEQKKLGAAAGDVSIAQLFLERASAYVEHPDGTPSTADEWRTAQLILDKVVPAYFVAVEKPGAALPSRTDRAVTVTLVRWPYT